MSAGEEGKIIEWKEKLEFMHEGHESAPVFDICDTNKLCVSAEMKRNIFMVWEPGVSMC